MAIAKLVVSSLVLVAAILCGRSASGADAHAPRAPAPDPAAVRAVQERIRGMFPAECADIRPEARRAFARRLLAMGAATVEAGAEKFALLREALERATAADDLAAAREAIDELGRGFEVDPLALRLETLAAIVPGAERPIPTLAVAGEGIALAGEAMEAGALDLAGRAGAIATAAAGAAGDQQVIAHVKAEAARMASLRPAYEQLAQALAALKVDPGDGVAALAAGSILCFVKGAWDEGLPHLAKGSDTDLARAATVELASPTTPQDMQACAELWLGLAERSPLSDRKRALAAHAFVWCSRATPHLSPLDRAALEKRTAAMRALALAPSVEALLGPVTMRRGLAPGPNVGDGAYEPAIVDGVHCVRLVKRSPLSTNRLHLYFDVDDAWASAMKGDAVEILIEYRARGPGSVLVEYDAEAGEYAPATNAAAASGGSTWETSTVRCPNPRFANRQNRSTDFRITQLCPELLVRRVAVAPAR
jgi:hypothetical protein